jgi:hypothetical protein
VRVEYKSVDVIIFGLGGARPEGSMPSQVVITWQLEPVRTGLDQVLFRVERCLSPAFDVDEIVVIDHDIAGVNGQVIYETVDVTAALINRWRRYYYRIVAEGPDAEAVTSEVKSWDANLNAYEIEIIGRNQFLLEFNTGIPCFVFIERTADAPRCSCIDPTTLRPMISDCPICLGVGRQRPFFLPIQTFADFNPTVDQVRLTAFGEMQPGQTDVWWGAFPPCKPRDLFLEAIEGKLWRVVNVRPVRFQATTIQQIARLEQVNLTDVEYRGGLKVDPELRKSLIRQFEETRTDRRF